MPKIVDPADTPTHSKDAPIAEYAWKTTEDLAQSAGLGKLSCCVRILEQGKYSYPYHFHHNAEEIFLILSGNGELRTPAGIAEIHEGNIIFFEKGESGAHQAFNPHATPLVYIDLRTVDSLDVCEYPDSGKVNILPKRDIFQRGKDSGYFDGEANIKRIWDELGSHG
ncbi:MAG: cupin domain-containing protein [Spirochaetia bacterium]